VAQLSPNKEYLMFLRSASGAKISDIPDCYVKYSIYPNMEIAKSIINFFIASGVLAWLIRSIVKLYLDKDIEKYKSELERNVNVHKSLHTERMIVIKEIYKKIDNTFHTAERLIQPNQLISTGAAGIIQSEFEDNLNNLSNYFSGNKIFFNTEHAADIEAFINDLRDVLNSWPLKSDLAEGIVTSAGYITESGKNWTQLQESTRKLKEKLERMFRLLIGVN